MLTSVMTNPRYGLALIWGLLLAHGAAHAQSTEEFVGDPHAGKYFWQTLATSSCKNCHGIWGEGGFGPALAGRGLTTEDFVNAIRNPILMATFPQYDDQQMADFAAFPIASACSIIS